MIVTAVSVTIWFSADAWNSNASVEHCCLRARYVRNLTLVLCALEVTTLPVGSPVSVPTERAKTLDSANRELKHEQADHGVEEITGIRKQQRARIQVVAVHKHIAEDADTRCDRQCKLHSCGDAFPGLKRRHHHSQQHELTEVQHLL